MRTVVRFPLHVRSLGAALALASFAAAGEYHVSATSGSDATGTGSASNPWQTLTFALAHLPAGQSHTIHIATGLHDAALGELYPLALAPGTNLIGAGVGATILDAGGRDVIGIATDPRGVARLRGLTLRNGNHGVFQGPPFPAGPSFTKLGFELAELSIEGMSGCAVRTGTGAFGVAKLRLTSVRAATCAVGVGLAASGSTASIDALLLSCTLDGCGTGLLASADRDQPGPGPVLAHVRLDRTRVVGCGIGIDVRGASAADDGTGVCDLALQDSLAVTCGTGLRALGDNDVALVRSTLAGNAIGMTKTTPGASWTGLLLYDAIVWGNQSADLFSPLVPFTAAYSDTPGGPLPGAGNVSVDPQFVDPAQSNFRLAAGSPVIDRGSPATPQVGTDRQLDPRVLDGDGDRQPRVDLGYDEWNPVHMDAGGAPSPGTSYALSISAPPGWATLLFVSAGTADIALGAAGSILIDPATAVAVALAPAPSTWSAAIPGDPALVGVDFHAQALGAAPAGAHLSLSNRIDGLVQ